MVGPAVELCSCLVLELTDGRTTVGPLTPAGREGCAGIGGRAGAREPVTTRWVGRFGTVGCGALTRGTLGLLNDRDGRDTLGNAGRLIDMDGRDGRDGWLGRLLDGAGTDMGMLELRLLLDCTDRPIGPLDIDRLPTLALLDMPPLRDGLRMPAPRRWATDSIVADAAINTLTNVATRGLVRMTATTFRAEQSYIT